MIERDILIAELGMIVVLGMIFLVLYGLPTRSRDPRMAWHIASLTAVSVVEAAMLFLVTIGVLVPWWTILVIFAAADVLMVWRLVLLMVPHGLGGGAEVSEPTQSKHPVRAALRTTVAVVVALLPVLPEIAAKLGVVTVPVVAVVLAAAAGVTRVLAMPAVEAALHRFVPWLAAQPPPVVDAPAD